MRGDAQRLVQLEPGLADGRAAVQVHAAERELVLVAVQEAPEAAVRVRREERRPIEDRQQPALQVPPAKHVILAERRLVLAHAHRVAARQADVLRVMRCQAVGVCDGECREDRVDKHVAIVVGV